MVGLKTYIESSSEISGVPSGHSMKQEQMPLENVLVVANMIGGRQRMKEIRVTRSSHTNTLLFFKCLLSGFITTKYLAKQ